MSGELSEQPRTGLPFTGWAQPVRHGLYHFFFYVDYQDIYRATCNRGFLTLGTAQQLFAKEPKETAVCFVCRTTVEKGHIWIEDYL